MPKKWNPEVKERIKYAAELIAAGHSKRAVKEKLCEKFGDYPQKAEYWWKMGLKSLEASDEKHMENLRRVQKERLETIIAASIEKKDYSSATKAVETLNKMFGIYETKQTVEIKDTTIKFNFENDLNNDGENE